MARPSRLTKALHDKLVEAISSGTTLKVACALCKVSYGTMARWVHEGKDPANVPQRKFREDIRAARAKAEVMALQSIQNAGLNDDWKASAWFLTNSIRGRYLKSAVDIHKPVTNVSMADIARELEEEESHQTNGYVDNVPELIADRMGGDLSEGLSQE